MKTLILFSLIIITSCSTSGNIDTSTVNNENICVVDFEQVLTFSKDVQNLKIKRNTQINELKKMADIANKKIESEQNIELKKELSNKHLEIINRQKGNFDEIYAADLRSVETKINNLVESICKRKGGNKVINITGGINITGDVIKEMKK